jgi:hypothetical protein
MWTGLNGRARAAGWWLLVGGWFVGVAVNDVVLARKAFNLRRPEDLQSELRDLDVDRELRRASIEQLWVAVPGSPLARRGLRTRSATQGGGR